jgi:RNA polymerase sigma-70 factor (ECF subfamily)
MQYVKSAEDADEIVNDTFLVAWHKKAELTLDDSIKNYLYTIVRNKSLNLLKKKKLDAVMLEAEYEIASNDISIIEQLQAKETEKLVFEVIEKLPPRCKQIFILSRREGMPNKAIADLMQLSEKTIENQITIAIRVIKESLKHRQAQENGFKIVLLPWLATWLINSI